MKGYILTFKPTNSNNRTYLHQKLFGSLIYRKKKGIYTATYRVGMLSETPYWKMEDGCVFIEDIGKVNFDLLKELADIDVKEAEVDTEEPRMTTGIYKFKKLAEKKNAMFVI